MRKLLKSSLLVATLLLGVFGWAEVVGNSPAKEAADSFKDIKIDLTRGSYGPCTLLTDEEVASKDWVEFGVVVGEDGTLTRVAADDASANIVLKGKYHSDDHGWGNFSCTVPVQGPVKISMGSCAWGGDVTVKNAAGETVATFNTNIGACYHGNKTENIVSGYYKGTEATTLTIAGGSYTPYIAVEAVDPATLVEEATVTFGQGEAEGIVPAAVKAEVGSKVAIPVNRTLYVEGKTLTAWTDGTTEYALGSEIEVPAEDVTLSPVFTENAVDFNDPREEIVVTWDFQRKNGAPVVGIQGKTALWVAQATIGENVIDVKMDVDATSGKLANGGWTDWAQINGGTVLTIPAAKGMVVELESYSATTTTTIAGDEIGDGTTTPSYTYNSTSKTVDIVIGDGSYWRTVKVTYPAIAEGTPVWRDIKLDLTNGNFLTEEELGGASINFGVTIDAEGNATRVAADDASANIVLKGKFHSNEHGWGNFSSTVKVEGPVKVSMGSCAWGGNVSVKNAEGEEVVTFNTNNGACYHNNKEANIVSAIYKGDATTLTIAGGSYTPYIAVEYVDPATLVSDATITFSLGETGAEGIVPASIVKECGKTVKMPVNKTVYLEGHTLVAWTDGENEYKIGEEMTVPEVEALTLTPVFQANAVSMTDPREGEVAVVWDFQQKNGAPVVGIEGKTAVWVGQATIGENVIDVKMDVDATSGKLANGNWTDWAQINGGTVLTIPAAKTVKITLESYSPTTTTTIDGEKIDLGTTTPTYDYAGDAETIDIVIGDGSYWRYVKAVYPAIKESSAGKVYTNETASVVWKFNSSADYESNEKAPADGFAAAEVNIGDLTITGTGARTADDLAPGITFLKLKPAGTTKAVEWSVKPAKGLTFTPTKVSMWIQRFGTDAENGVVVTAKLADGTTESLGTFTAPRANQDQTKDKFAKNSNWTNQVVIELTAEQQAKLASTEGFTISATVGVGASKEGGFSDVHIEGVLNGTIADVAKYTLAVNVTPEEAGSVTAKPKAAEYEEGTEITLTAAKNFGYNFVNWTDAEGNVLGEETVYKFEINENTEINANFVAVNTYELAYSVDAESGAKLYMVTPTPAPTVVDGKNMYEDGTKVTLTAASNPILTFTNWSDGQTSGEITIDMTQDVDIVANYTPADYIAGWDFILPGNNGRVADFAAADNDADQLVLRDAEGTTYGWLDKSWQGQGGYEGRPAGVNWTTIELGKTYWQTKINAAAFTSITLQTAMVYNYNAYQTYNVEYSLDNENWTLAGQIKMPGTKAWTDLTVTLPEECDNQEAVYVRWIADKTSSIDGTSSNNDGATIGATYFTGTPKFVNDGVAPVLIASVPEQGAANASANGKIVLTFDEKIKLTDVAKATLNDVELAGVATGKTATFEYKGLTYETDYMFTLAAGSVADLGDNAVNEDIVINFTTKAKPEIAKALYDFVVPTDGNFREAIEAANARADKSARYRIFVKAGSHIIPTKGERAGTNQFEGNMYPDPRLDLTVNNVSIIGEGLEETTITNICPATVDGVNPIEGLRNAYTLHNSGAYTYIQDLKLVNGMADNTGRGEAYEESGDKTILKNVGLWGYQDTYCSNNGRGRYYFEGGVVRGRTDYICGKDDIFFNGVTFQNCAAGYIAVPSTPYKYGWILKDCTIKSEPGKEAECDGKYTLGRPWGKGTPVALWIDTKMESQPSAIGWSEMSGGWPARFAEYNSVTATGTVIDLSGRKTIYADTHENNPVLTKEEADFYTIARVMGGDDDWDPTAATEQASAPTNVVLSDGQLTWDNSSYALLWAVCKNGKVVDFTIEPAYTVDDTAAETVWSVRAANEMGGLGEATVATANTADAISSVNNGLKVVKTAYFNAAGLKVNASHRGVTVKVETLENGQTVTTKLAR